MVQAVLERRKSNDQIGATLSTPPLLVVLRQLQEVVEGLSDAQYTQKPVGVIESSIGGHVRHCLDHVQALLIGAVSGSIDYDRRERGTPIESSRNAALRCLCDLSAKLELLATAGIDTDVTVSALMCSDQPPLELRSTLARELAYVLSHTIHHNALIGAMVQTLAGRLPDRFGYAPSTVAYQDRCACAR